MHVQVFREPRRKTANLVPRSTMVSTVIRDKHCLSPLRFHPRQIGAKAAPFLSLALVTQITKITSFGIATSRHIAVNRICQPTLSTNSVNQLCQPTLSTDSVNRLCQPTLTTDSDNRLCPMTLSANSVPTLFADSFRQIFATFRSSALRRSQSTLTSKLNQPGRRSLPAAPASICGTASTRFAPG